MNNKKENIAKRMIKNVYGKTAIWKKKKPLKKGKTAEDVCLEELNKNETFK